MSGRSAVLVVDDDAVIRRMVAYALRREQYDVAEAANGGEALESLRSRRFGVMVLDMMMPLVSGAEVIRYLDTHDDAGTPCIVVMSAATDSELNRIASPAVLTVIRKPFDPSAIVAAVRTCTDGSRAAT